MRADENKNFSKEQKEAIEFFGRNVYVLAGAGSGKTTILVERFLHAITKKNIEPEKILTITFTEKAANEMKSRLVLACDQRGLSDFRRKLENAYVSTIHSFCARLLKENPIESGIDPYFRILGTGESEVVMERVMDALFEEEAGSDAWLKILAEFDEKNVRSTFKRFYDMSRALAAPERLFECRPLAAEKKGAVKKIVESLREFLLRLEKEPASSTREKLTEASPRLLELFQRKAVGGWEGIHSVLALRKSFDKRSPRFKAAVEELHALLDEWVCLEIQGMAVEMKKEFLRVFWRFKTLYEGEKRDLACYDFQDLLYLAHELLAGSEPARQAVRTRYQNLFSCILVDEHQDTSPLEAAIIELLKKEDNVFLVGDVQQSIYGFRGADPDVFKNEVQSGAEGGRGKKIILSENYRSREEILRFVNEVSSRLLKDVAVFEPLKAKRIFKSKKPHSVELLCITKEDSKAATLEKGRVVEARILARRIQELVDSGFQVEEKGGRTRPLRYGDIAILLRKSTASHLYEKELSDLQIPYFTYRGHGFYKQPEVMDIVNFLKVIENPNQDIPLAGVFRSPLVRITDDALFWLARGAKEKDRQSPLSAALGQGERMDKLSPEDRVKLKAFEELLCYLRENKDRLKLSELIETILDRTDYKSKVLVGSEGRQKLANVEKLVEISRSLEESGIFGIQDFISFLKNMSEQEVTEPEARIHGEGGNGVTLSTVHGAKGLEFSCVIVADMGSGTKKGSGQYFIASKEEGFGIRLKDASSGTFFPDFTYQDIQRDRKKKEEAEGDRLLYVAMTRAKEHLILSGFLANEPKNDDEEEGRTWMEKVAAIVGLEAVKSGEEEIEFQGMKIKLLKAQGKGGNVKPSEESFERQALIRELLENEKPLTETAAKKFGLPWDEKAAQELKNRLKPVEKPYEETEDHTVTDLLLASLTDVGKRRVLVREEPVAEEGDETDDTPRNEYGTVFHRLMEFLIAKRPKKLIKAFFTPRLLYPLGPAERKEITESILKFWNGDWGASLRKAKRCYPELPFIYKTRYGILKGQMDLAYQAQDGAWVILDYKTNRIAPKELASLAGQYEFQLGLYALIFKKLYGEAPKRGVLYFSTLDQTFEFAYQTKDFEGFEEKLDLYFRKIVSA